ncbi:MAG: hypothetical protein M5U13_13585 [Thermoanaerobaculia bacterium]|nr:hypothetical protein [Thermoanaerobaculia bacterium]
MEKRWKVLVVALLAAHLLAVAALAGVERILVEKEIDDDHIIVQTEKGELLLLEKWSMRFSPLVFEGKTFLAEVSPYWVVIHFDDREPIKWSIEKSLGTTEALPPAIAPGREARPGARPRAVEPTDCFRTSITEPTPFMGNGGEIFMLSDGSLWKDVSYQYLYLYAYYPSVIVCPREGKMIFDDHTFDIVRMK